MPLLAAAVAALVGCTPADDPGEPADGGPAAAQTDTADAADGASLPVPPLLGGDDGIDHWDETLVELDGGRLVVAAKVADTSDRRQQGLMRVPELPADAGMLFLFDDGLRTGGFWMRDTLVPLDIAYLDGDTIVDIQQMDPCDAMPCPTYDPAEPYDAALEVRQGLLDEAGIDVGATATWSPPQPAPDPPAGHADG